MKKCTQCGKLKPEIEFYKNKLKKDGLRCWCKCCETKYRHNNQERINELSKDWCHKNIKKRRKIARDYNIKNRDKLREYCRNHSVEMRVYRNKWEEKNPIKAECRRIYRNSLRRKDITRQPCSICNNPKSHGHHPDYSKPLEVIWLCCKHHKELHRKDPIISY